MHAGVNKPAPFAVNWYCCTKILIVWGRGWKIWTVISIRQRKISVKLKSVRTRRANVRGDWTILISKNWRPIHPRWLEMIPRFSQKTLLQGRGIGYRNARFHGGMRQWRILS